MPYASDPYTYNVPGRYRPNLEDNHAYGVRKYGKPHYSNPSRLGHRQANTGLRANKNYTIYLLCLFFGGYLGLHYYYLGKIGLPLSLCEDALEALIGAVCLDDSVPEAERVVRRLFFGGPDAAGEDGAELDAKSRLQILLQARDLGIPHYEVVSVSGPSHSPRFQVRLRVGNADRVAVGASRREAEELAAGLVLQDLDAAENEGGVCPP